MESLLQKHWIKAAKANLQDIANSPTPSYNDFWDANHNIITHFHKSHSSGLQTCQLNSQLTDIFIQHLFNAAIQHHNKFHPQWKHPIALIALGGYGRSELSPMSDIDLLLIHPQKIRPKTLQNLTDSIQTILINPLWDLNLKVSSITRTISQTIQEAKSDFRTLNAQLDARFLAGSNKLFNLFHSSYQKFHSALKPEKFINLCIQSQTQRHLQHSNTVFLQEPHIKNGVGGLRDYQNILWLARAKFGQPSLSILLDHNLLTPSEISKLNNAFNFLLRTRNELHFQTQRPSDLLYLEKQPYIADNLAYKSLNIFTRVEAFMHDYYLHANNIYKINSLLIERLQLSLQHNNNPQSSSFSLNSIINAVKPPPEKHIDGFILSNLFFIHENNNIFHEDPIRIIRIFRHCQQFHAKLHPDLKLLIQKSLHLITPAITSNPSAARSFRSILQAIGDVFPALSQMHELGVLPKFIPEFEKITYLVQHEFYHRYTADIHTLNTIKHLDDIFNSSSPFLKPYCDAIRSTTHPALLYLMLLLHDIGKSHGNKNHSISGATIAKTILDRLGIQEKQQEYVIFIIKNHLHMSRTWQRFDVDDPDVTYAFATTLSDPELLKYLFVHTFCDASGTSPDLWNSYKEMLHSRLYENTLNLFSQQEEDSAEERKVRKKKIYSNLLLISDNSLSKQQTQDIIQLHPDRYFTLSSPNEMELHLQLINKLQSNISKSDCAGSLMPVIHWKHDINQSLTIVTVVTWDRPGLFASLSGAFAASGLNILSTKAFTRSDRITIDTFYVVEANNSQDSEKNHKIIFESNLKNILVNDADPLPDIISQAKRILRSTPLTQQTPILSNLSTSINVYHEIALNRTIVEIHAHDQIGLLYRIAKAITSHGFDISFARISTEHSVAIDTFHITKNNIDESTGTHDLIQLREELNQVLQPNPQFSLQ